MLRDINFPENRFYTQNKINNPYNFFIDALSNSNRLDLLLGYFTLSSINVLSYGFANFLKNNGQLRIVLNEYVKEDDINAILEANSQSLDLYQIDLTNLEDLKRILSRPNIHFFECLAWLISKEKIQFQFIRNLGSGIPHNKDGIFYDGEDRVGFSGSCNFTGSGILKNLERVTVFLDWDDKRSKMQIDALETDFKDYFFKKSLKVKYLDPETIKENIVKTFGNKELEAILEDEKELLLELEKIIKKNNKYNIDVELQNIVGDCENSTPRFPYPEGPRAYQKEAYRLWLNNDYQGFFAMATGTGKTITSLNCVLEEYIKNGYYKFLVLVPTIALAHQWEVEIKENFNFYNLILCNSDNSFWEDEIRDIGRSIKLNKKINYCILTTYATFRSVKFSSLFNNFFKSEFNKITLIADEAHTFGSESLLKIMPTQINKRLGLSATPERQFDEIGEKAISEYFNSYSPNYTFSYNMKKAIEDKVLCRYYYYPKFVDLNQEELNQYVKISKKLMQYFDFERGRYKDNDYVKQLLIKRKDIIHKANNKSACLINIVNQIGPASFNHAFIYVPEGFDQDYEKSDIDDFDIKVDDAIIQNYTQILYDNFKFKLRTFTGKTNDRVEVLNQFKNGQLNALLAMKCLDEGVDIPQTKYAIFCSSTGNPRQYIQRRGRVLRNYKGKDYAYLYDMIVKPKLDPTNNNPDLIKIEKSIFRSELVRLINFAVLSENKSECLSIIEPYCLELDIDIYDLANKEEEKYKY